jgi:hypothetical protein
MSARAHIGSAERIAFVWLAVLGALVFMLVWTGSALAAYEQQPEHFGTSGEAVFGGGNSSYAMAVNVNGAGGVQAGSFYVVGDNSRVMRFAPGSEGQEPRFEEAWGWGIAEGGPGQAYVRCGPAYHGTANPAEHTYEHCISPGGEFGGEESGHFGDLGGVAVDQTTGDVYVRNANLVLAGELVRAHHLIEVFTPRGVPVGEGFGDSGDPFSTPPESIAEGPGKLHRIGESESPIAVDGTGAVYVLDKDYEVEHPETRVMVFRPCTAGDYESYCYATGEDIPLSDWESEPFQMSLVGDTKLVVASYELIREYPLGGHNPAPICSRAVTGQLQAMTTNLLSGEVFYSRFGDHSIRRLGPCNEATGEFPELQKLKPEPLSPTIFALAVNPSLAWGPTRPKGVLYAADSINAVGDVLAPAKVAVPIVESESTANVDTSAATLQAQIDPRGAETKYTFQYLTVAQYDADGGFGLGTVGAPVSPGEIPSGQVATVTTGVSGLDTGTTYVYRVLADSFCDPEHPQTPCETAGGPAFFATYSESPAGLPDGRAYELVSPPDKNGGEVFPADPIIGSCDLKSGENSECKPPGRAITVVYPMQAAPGGDAVAYMGQAFSSTEGSSAYDSYVSRRTANGWQTTAMSPALLATRASGNSAYNTQLTEDVISQGSPQLSPQAPVGYANLYFQSATDPGSLTPLVTTIPPDREPTVFGVTYGGQSPDFSAQFFAANDALTPATGFAPKPPDPGVAGSDLYEWREGRLTLVNVLPDNATVASGARFASASHDAHGVSANGRRVFWETNNHLYVRENGQVTREIAHPGTFLSASEDGLSVLLSDGCLYSLLTEMCTDLTQGQGGFEGILGNNGDLSRIYFVDKAALTPEAKAGTCTRSGDKQTGKEENEGKIPPGLGCNLYVYEAGIGARLVTTLAALDGAALTDYSTPNDWAALANQRTAEASPDGRYLAFESTARLTGYDNVGLCGLFTNSNHESELGDIRCIEVFVYDSVTGRLFCASCNPTGETPPGSSTLRRIGGGTGGKPWIPQPRYVTDQGRVFFDSQDRLSPRDTNGSVEDVYESEPGGVGSCERVGGCVLLISPGTGTVDSNFLAMDENGANVFFTTRERLAPADTDELLDLYDAREGGGFPEENEASASGCGGEACQQSISSPLVSSTLASVVFQGAGNIKPGTSPPPGTSPSGKVVLRCPNGKVKEKTKCVNRKKRQSKQSKRHVKRKQKRTVGRKRGGAK